MKKRIAIISILGILSLLSGCNTATSVPDPAERPNVKAASYNVQLGLAYLKDKQYTRARSKLLLALTQGPHYPEAYESMGYFLEQTGETEKAGQYYRKAIELNPKSGQAQNNYGAYLCRQKQYNAAIDRFMQAVQDTKYLTPAAAYENAGYCALEIPNQTLAINFFKQALKEDPRRAMSALELAEINFAKGNVANAQHYLTYYSQYAPPGPESLWLQIRLAQKTGNLDKADSAALLLKGQFPDSAEAKLAKRVSS
ncbi:MAG: type IV pilus biogenesis/stability protein PilW [Legionellales bacterium]|nr:type IV pilus biogenesis/stability protein PilW [Legionellales bacterium]